MAHDVFISHSSKDKTVADAVCANLEQHKVRCWIAPRDIAPGAEWGEAIVDAIGASRVMILIFSASANDSPQIRREVERAVNKGVIIVPVRIEDVTPTRSLEYFIGSVHWLDAMSLPLENHLEKLIRVVQGILLRDVASGPSARQVHGEAVNLAPEPSIRREVTPLSGGGVSPSKSQTEGSEGGTPSLLSTPGPASRSESKQPHQEEESKIRCRHCGEPTIPKLKRCSHCGGNLGFQSVLKWAFFGLAILLVASGVVSWKVRERVSSAPKFLYDRVVFESLWDDESPASFQVTAKFPDLKNWKRRGDTALAFSPDGQTLAASARTMFNNFGDVRIVDVETGREIRRFVNDMGPILGLGFSANGRWLAASGLRTELNMPRASNLRKSYLKVWNIQTGEEIQDLGFSSVMSQGRLCSVAFSSNGRWIATACAGDSVGTIQIWDFTIPSGPRTSINADGLDLTFNSDGRFVGTKTLGQDNDTYHVWETSTGREVSQVVVRGNAYGSSIDPSGRFLAAIRFHDKYSNAHPELWDLRTGKSVESQSMVGRNGVAFSPDGTWLAIAPVIKTQTDKFTSTLELWDTSWMSRVHKGTLIVNGDVEDFIFNSDWRFLATADNTSVVRIWKRQP